MNKFFTFLLFSIISAACAAQKGKPVIISDTVYNETILVTKASADSVQQFYLDSLKSINEQVEKSFNGGYIIIGLLVGVFGLVFAVVTGFGIYAYVSFKDQTGKSIANFEKTSNEAKTSLDTFRNEISERTSEYTSLITSMGTVINILLVSNDPIVTDAIKSLLKSQRIITLGRVENTVDIDEVILACQNQHCQVGFFKTTLAIVERRNISSTFPGGRPPVTKKCPHCDTINNYSSGRPTPLPL